MKLRPGQPLAATAWDPAWAQVEIEHFRTLWDWGVFHPVGGQEIVH